MWFSKKLGEKVLASQVTTKAAGDAAESIALAHLRTSGLKLLETNYRTPGRGGGEIDLIMKDLNGTLVFIEVRQRASQSHGGAGASITKVKQRRIVFAAQHYLMRFKTLPPCRFDVVLVHGGLGTGDTPGIEWLRSAFDAL
jgi:putative endonuclease